MAKLPNTIFFLMLLMGCSTGITVHDEARAAELVVDCLTGFKSKHGTRLAYEWTDDSYKEDVTFPEFSQIVASIRKLNQGADIRLTGFEALGSREVFIVYANSDTEQGRVYYKFTLVGTKTKDYYLIDLNVNDAAFASKGIYGEYRRAIVVEGV